MPYEVQHALLQHRLALLYKCQTIYCFCFAHPIFISAYPKRDLKFWAQREWDVVAQMIDVKIFAPSPSREKKRRVDINRRYYSI